MARRHRNAGAFAASPLGPSLPHRVKGQAKLLTQPLTRCGWRPRGAGSQFPSLQSFPAFSWLRLQWWPCSPPKPTRFSLAGAVARLWPRPLGGEATAAYGCERPRSWVSLLALRWWLFCFSPFLPAPFPAGERRAAGWKRACGPPPAMRAAPPGFCAFQPSKPARVSL